MAQEKKSKRHSWAQIEVETYGKKLNEKELDWLKSFNNVFYNGGKKNNEEFTAVTGIVLDKDFVQECSDRDVMQRFDLLNSKQLSGKHYVPGSLSEIVSSLNEIETARAELLTKTDYEIERAITPDGWDNKLINKAKKEGRFK